ncbi:MAG: AAA family ATPase [Synechococcaceae cyanobacterium]|nr:AAA family ATPase [Synechococcaceae cyanobacterium]
MKAPVRCHLLIGPPASGKTTLAQKLAPLLTEPGVPPALVLSTDRIRGEVVGDAAVQDSLASASFPNLLRHRPCTLPFCEFMGWLRASPV